MSKIFFFKLLMLLSMSIIGQSSDFFDYQFSNTTYGSNKLEQPIKILKSKKNVFVFSNTGSTTINGDLTNVYGSGDIVIQKFDSIGGITNKIIGGGGLDVLLNVEQDLNGFWLYIQSKSGTSGVRQKPLNCLVYNNSISGSEYRDFWILRLDNQLNYINDYSICFPNNAVNSSYFTYNLSKVKLFNNKIYILGSFSVDSNAVYTYNNRPLCDYLIIADTAGIIQQKIYLGRTAPYGSLLKLTFKDINVNSDSVVYISRDYINSTNGSLGNVIKLNTITLNKTNILLSKTSNSSVNIVNSLFKEGKLFVFSNCIPNKNYGSHINTLTGSLPYLYKINRAAPNKASVNNTDVWCVILDSITLSYINEFSIGANDSTLLSNAYVNDNNIYLAMSTKGGIVFDKNSNNKGNFDYWFVQLDNNFSVSKQISYGGNNEDLLTDVLIKDGSIFFSGRSKSNISFDKMQNSRDNSLYGDIWNISGCSYPFINYTTDTTIYNYGSLLKIDNNSKGVINYTWAVYDNNSSFNYSYKEDPSFYLYNSDTATIFLLADNYQCGLTSTKKIYVNPYVVSINELNSELINVYPNPFTNSLSINFDQLYKDLDVSIYNSIGQIIIELKKQNSDNLYLKLDDIEKGIYFLKIKFNDKSITKKIIKE